MCGQHSRHQIDLLFSDAESKMVDSLETFHGTNQAFYSLIIVFRQVENKTTGDINLIYPVLTQARARRTCVLFSHFQKL